MLDRPSPDKRIAIKMAVKRRKSTNPSQTGEMSERTAAKEKTGNSAARHTVKAGLIPIPYFARRFSMVLASARSDEKIWVTSGSSDLI